MNKHRYFYKDTYHHLYNRGTNKMNIFIGDENYFFFLKQMSFYKEKYKIKILAYCLMPNHFHIFASQTTDELSISHFMSALSNSYTKSFNKLFNRIGILFESKFKSKEIEVIDYFKIVVKYIIDNPVAAGLVDSNID